MNSLRDNQISTTDAGECKNQSKSIDFKAISNFLFEAGMLKKTKRTGYAFLGSGGESVADHSFRVAIIGHILSEIIGYNDPYRVILMCLLHDLPEARTGDQNYVHKQYVETNEKRAYWDATQGLPCTKLYRDLWLEYDRKETKASIIAHDADQLDLLIELKEQLDLGNQYAKKWIKHLIERLNLEESRRLAREILETDWTSWWFDGHESWWRKR